MPERRSRSSPQQANPQRSRPSILQNQVRRWAVQCLQTLIRFLDSMVQQLESESPEPRPGKISPRSWNSKSVLIGGIVVVFIAIASTKTGLLGKVPQPMTTETQVHTPLFPVSSEVQSQVQSRIEPQVKADLALTDLPPCKPEALPELSTFEQLEPKLSGPEWSDLNGLDSLPDDASEPPASNPGSNPSSLDKKQDGRPERLTTIPTEIVAIAPPEAVMLTEAIITQPNLEQQLLNSIQAQVTKKISLSGHQIILSVQAKFLESLLQVKLSSQWYQLTEDKQNQLIKELWKQAQQSDFTKLAVMNPQDKLIARNPMVGSEIIILERKIDEML